MGGWSVKCWKKGVEVLSVTRGVCVLSCRGVEVLRVARRGWSVN